MECEIFIAAKHSAKWNELAHLIILEIWNRAANVHLTSFLAIVRIRFRNSFTMSCNAPAWTDVLTATIMHLALLNGLSVEGSVEGVADTTCTKVKLLNHFAGILCHANHDISSEHRTLYSKLIKNSPKNYGKWPESGRRFQHVLSYICIVPIVIKLSRPEYFENNAKPKVSVLKHIG